MSNKKRAGINSESDCSCRWYKVTKENPNKFEQLVINEDIKLLDELYFNKFKYFEDNCE